MWYLRSRSFFLVLAAAVLFGCFHVPAAFADATDTRGQNIVLEGCVLPSITVMEEGARVVAAGDTVVDKVILEAGATLLTSTGAAFGQVLVSDVVPPGSRVVLDGDFGAVTVCAQDAKVEIAGGVVQKLTLETAAHVFGGGALGSVSVHKNGATIAQTPQSIRLEMGVSVMVGDQWLGGPERSASGNSSRSSGGRKPVETDPDEDEVEPTPVPVDRNEITGIAPVSWEIPLQFMDMEQYTGTVLWYVDGETEAISWNPEKGRFGVDKEYTAAITLEAKDGFTLEGLADDFFTVAGATYTVKDPDSGVITATFPKTGYFAGGKGTAGDPWEITNAFHLNNVRDYLGKDYNFILSDDIDLTGFLNGRGDNAGWDPIGKNAKQSFEGRFNGNGHEITGLWVNRPKASYVGLFGYTLSDAVIENLNLDVNVFGGTMATGGLIGYSHKTTITNCTVSGSVHTSADNPSQYTGGLAGFNNGIIRSSVNSAQVHGGNNTGGIVGWNAGAVENCYNTGYVQGKDRTGGLVGQNASVGTITNCYSCGAVRGNANTRGLVGSNAGTVTSSFWDIIESGCVKPVGDATGKSTEQMHKEETYDDWDFESIWCLDNADEINDGYPYLRWQTAARDN